MSAAFPEGLNEFHTRFDGAKRIEAPGIAEQRARGAPGWRESIETWIGAHPHLCVGAAIAVGVTIGWLVKRR